MLANWMKLNPRDNIYSGRNKYLIPFWICRFAHLERNCLSVILMAGLCEQWEIENHTHKKEIDFKESM